MEVVKAWATEREDSDLCAILEGLKMPFRNDSVNLSVLISIWDFFQAKKHGLFPSKKPHVLTSYNFLLATKTWHVPTRIWSADRHAPVQTVLEPATRATWELFLILHHALSGFCAKPFPTASWMCQLERELRWSDDKKRGKAFLAAAFWRIDSRRQDGVFGFPNSDVGKCDTAKLRTLV